MRVPILKPWKKPCVRQPSRPIVTSCPHYCGMSALLRIESKLDEQEMRRKAFWKATNNFGPMLFFGAALGVMLAVLLK